MRRPQPGENSSPGPWVRQALPQKGTSPRGETSLCPVVGRSGEDKNPTLPFPAQCVHPRQGVPVASTRQLHFRESGTLESSTFLIINLVLKSFYQTHDHYEIEKLNNIVWAGSSASSRNERSCPLDDCLPLAYDRHWLGSKG